MYPPVGQSDGAAITTRESRAPRIAAEQVQHGSPLA